MKSDLKFRENGKKRKEKKNPKNHCCAFHPAISLLVPTIGHPRSSSSLPKFHIAIHPIHSFGSCLRDCRLTDSCPISRWTTIQ